MLEHVPSVSKGGWWLLLRKVCVFMVYCYGADCSNACIHGSVEAVRKVFTLQMHISLKRGNDLLFNSRALSGRNLGRLKRQAVIEQAHQSAGLNPH